MAFIDIALLIIIIAFILYGVWGGLIKRLSQFFGLIVGIWISTLFYQPIGAILESITPLNTSISESIAFIILFAGITGAATYLIEKILSIIKIIPFVKLFDRFLGGTLGALISIIILALLFISIENLPFGDRLIEPLSNSTVASFIISMSEVFLPKALEALQIVTNAVS